MKNQSGAALVLALAALVVVALAVLWVAAQLDGHQVSFRHEYRHAVLDSLADAAFAEALARLSADTSYQGSSLRSFGHGTIGTEVTPAGPRSRRVLATAEFQGWVTTIDSEVDITAGPRVVHVRRAVLPAAMSEDTR